MSRVIGIDLGTTNSVVAVVDDAGTPRVLSAADGERITPSVIAFTDDGSALVGVPARRQAVTNPHRTIYGTKRLVGRKVNAEEVAWFAKIAPFRIVAAPNGDAWVRMSDVVKSPQEVSSHVLRRLRAIAEEALGEPVTRAVLTVPAYFNEAQRQATRDASTIAGLDAVRILNEPTAAALAYGAHRVKKGRRIIAVFDLGGGTFDVSIMAVEDGIFEVLATNGDMSLGGDDWDRRIIEMIADEVFDRDRVDVTTSPVALGRLKEEAEKAKIELSGGQEAVVRLPYLAQSPTGEPIHLERAVTRAEFEQRTIDLVEKLRAPCERALADAGIDPAEIEEVLLAGGMSRTPSVQAIVESIFRIKPSRGANPDEIVALGAAAYGGILAGLEKDDAALLDVTPHDISIKIGTSDFAVLIPRNSMLPVRTAKRFATTSDDQKYVQIEVYQGESNQLGENKKLGQVTMADLPTGKAGTVRIELTLTISVESLLSVTARELSTGRETRVSIKPSGGLSQSEIYEIISRRRTEGRADESAESPDAPDSAAPDSDQ
ncbi:MAG TPA: Hsp70 family protein [Kofleriaceae bacterium]|nr:Hsp70 family protein [Kofleriaceae bacterium]